MSDPNLVIEWAFMFLGICLICSIDFERLRDWPQDAEIGEFADSPRFQQRRVNS